MTDLRKHSVDPKLDLVLERVVDLPPELIFAAWTRAELMPRWFAPLPWTAEKCSVDPRPGGSFNVMMRSPEGQEVPCRGCILEIVENRRLVWTDCLLGDYRPSATPFFTAVIDLEPHAQGTKYTVIAKHPDEATRKKHEEMGFQSGWNQCLDQLVAAMKK